MATKKAQKATKLEKAKSIVKKINNDLIDASFKAIETTVKTGEKWQKLTAKLIKKAEPLTKQQIGMFVDTAENIKGQLETGTDRLKNLVGYDPTMFEQAKKMIKSNPLAQKAEEMTSKVKKDVADNPLVKKAEKMATKLKKEITETIEEVKEKVENITEDVKDKVENITEDIKEKVEDVVKTSKPSVKSTIKNDLKVLHGIGPKMETVLNENGITSYEDLSKLTLKSIEKTLTDAGVNPKMYNLSDWKAQAKLAAKGNMEAVSQWIKENKSKK